MRRLSVVVLCALCLSAALPMSAMAHPAEQRWTVLTRPGEPTHVIATGTLTARGTVTDVFILNPDGTFDNLATQTYPDGQIFYHGQGTFALDVDPRTCIGVGEVDGPFVITGGTGAYVGASGSGVALIRLQFFFGQTESGCTFVPDRVYGVARATGTLDIP
jgi:hypothetical protein